MKKITIVTPCYNEEENVDALYRRVKEVFAGLPQYQLEHLFIDNASLDRTASILRGIAAQDKSVKVIVNNRNFGHIRSPYYGLLQAEGDAAILVAADFQDPPEMIPQFLEKWESGFKIVMGVKTESEETAAMFMVRKFYYDFVGRIADIKLIKNFTGFGLYDRVVLQTLRKINDPYPYFRGLLAELGYESAKISFKQPTRKRGITKNNFYTLYDMAMLGITNHSKIPLRLVALLGFVMSLVSLMLAVAFFAAKLIFWNHFTVGTAPILIGVFFFSSVQLFFIGVMGEYIGAIYTQVLNRPIVVEKERINF